MIDPVRKLILEDIKEFKHIVESYYDHIEKICQEGTNIGVSVLLLEIINRRTPGFIPGGEELYKQKKSFVESEILKARGEIY